MQIIKGIKALSEFRLRKLLDQLQELEPTITEVSAEFIHLIDEKTPSSDGETKSLTELLSYGSKYSADRIGELFFVTPRIGTTSPWSSKATDIAKNSGLIHINRIERGVAYYIKSSSNIKQPDSVADILHDRMTETVFSQINEAEILFTEAPPNLLMR